MNQITSAPLIRILKAGTCPNLSGSAKLGYHIGCTADSKIHLHVHSNSGSGYFSKEWVSLDAILKALDKAPKGKPLTAFWLSPLFVGKSINTPSFLMAVLLQEGLVQKDERCYERLSHDAFVIEVNKLIESGVDLKVDDKSQKAKPQKVADKSVQADAKPQKAEVKPQQAAPGKKKAMPQKKG